MRISPNAAAADTEIKGKKSLLTLGKFLVDRDLQQDPLASTSNPYRRSREGVNPGLTPSSHSSALLAPELPRVSPAFPPGAQSLFQAMT